MKGLEEIDREIQSNIQVFKRPGVLTVRPGYRIKNKWITAQRAIVVTVRKKDPKIRGKNALPRKVGGYPTDAPEADLVYLLNAGFSM